MPYFSLPLVICYKIHSQSPKHNPLPLIDPINFTLLLFYAMRQADELADGHYGYLEHGPSSISLPVLD